MTFKKKVERFFSEPVVFMAIFFIIAVLLFFGLTSLINKQDSNAMEDIKKRGTLIIGIREDIEPFAYRDNEGNLCGFEVELAELITEKILGERYVEFKIVSAKNKNAYLDYSYIDIVIALFDKRVKTADKEKFTFSDAYYLDPIKLVSKQSDFRPLENSKIGAISSSLSKDYFSDYVISNGLDDINIINYAAIPDMIDALGKNEIDAFCYELSALKNIVLEEFFVSEQDYGEMNCSIATKSSEKDLHSEVVKAFKTIKENGELSALYQKYNIKNP